MVCKGLNSLFFSSLVDAIDIFIRIRKRILNQVSDCYGREQNISRSNAHSDTMTNENNLYCETWKLHNKDLMLDITVY